MPTIPSRRTSHEHTTTALVLAHPFVTGLTDGTLDTDVFAHYVAQVLDLTDRIGLVLNPTDEAVARAHFVTTSRYEWMFFDAAYRREDWPV